MFNAVSDEKLASELVEPARSRKRRKSSSPLSEGHARQPVQPDCSEGEMKELNIIVKADVQGSAEAVRQSP